MAIESDQRTLVLQSKDNREIVLKTLRDSGARVLHDSGERVIVVKVEQERRLEGRLPATSRLLPIKDDVAQSLAQPTDNELLFINALQLRASTEFQEEKRHRKPGSTPEEQELFQASCIPEQNTR